MRALLLALVLVACSSATPPTRCTPGASVPCVCPGVGTGAQVCAADGASYGACVCGVDASAADVAVGVDAADVVDVPPPPSDRPDVVSAPDVVDVAEADAPDVVDVPRDLPPIPVDALDLTCGSLYGARCGFDMGDLRCTDLRSDDMNCGRCGNVCPPDRHCSGDFAGIDCSARRECDPDGATRRCWCPNGNVNGRESTRLCSGGRYGACRCGDAGV